MTPIWIPDTAHEDKRDLVPARATSGRDCPRHAQQIVLPDYIHAVQDAEARLDRLTRQIERLLSSWSMAPLVTVLQAMLRIALVIAVTVVAEVGDFRRFVNARKLMAYLGLIPSEHSSGGSVRRRGITKAGNVLARRALIGGPGPIACRHASAASFMTAMRAVACDP